MSLCRKPTGVNSGEKIKCQTDTSAARPEAWFVFCKERGSDVTSVTGQCDMLVVMSLVIVQCQPHHMSWRHASREHVT